MFSNLRLVIIFHIAEQQIMNNLCLNYGVCSIISKKDEIDYALFLRAATIPHFNNLTELHVIECPEAFLKTFIVLVFTN